MNERIFSPLNGIGKYGPFWAEEIIKKIIGKPKYQKLYLIPNTLIPNKKKNSLNMWVTIDKI